jgi:hypothetical protein
MKKVKLFTKRLSKYIAMLSNSEGIVLSVLIKLDKLSALTTFPTAKKRGIR